MEQSVSPNLPVSETNGTVQEPDLNEVIELAQRGQLVEWLKTFPPEAPLLVVAVYNAYEDVVECLESLLATVPPRTPLLVLDDASPDTRLPALLEPLSKERGFAYVRKPVNRGLVHSGNLSFEVAAPRDVVFINSDTVLPPRWLERLRAAAYARSTVGTATPFSNNAVIYSVPYRNTPIPYLAKNMTVEQIDARIEAHSLKLRPVIPVAMAFCTYFRREALDLVGYYDEIFSPGYGEEVDFCQRVNIAGFSNVLADDLFVYHKGSRSFGNNERKQKIQDSHEEIVKARYPWHYPWVEAISTDRKDPLARAIERARGALLGYRVAIDATCVSDYTTGTQLVTLELAQALLRQENRPGYLALIINDEVHRPALYGLDNLVDEVFTVAELEELKEQPVFDLAHRPFQVNTLQELQFLQKVASRVVISHLDCIGFSNPSYYGNPEDWLNFRRLTRQVFESVDGVAFISQDALEDARHRGLVFEDSRAAVTYVGVDHHLHKSPPQAPDKSEALKVRPYILMLGTNFRHKNRVYGLRLLKALIKKYGWTGQLVFAGPSVAEGGSGAGEALEKLAEPELRSRVHYLGAVNEGQKQWLLQNAALVLYPSSYEGFGLVPFEAAEAGVPVISTRSTSLKEVLGDKVAYLETYRPEEGAEQVWALLTRPEVAAAQLEAIKARKPLFSWDRVAAKTLEFYESVMAQPLRPTEAGSLEYILRIKELEQAYKELQDWASDINTRLNAIQGRPAYRVLSRLNRL